VNSILKLKQLRRKNERASKQDVAPLDKLAPLNHVRAMEAMGKNAERPFQSRISTN
jgi:hypothetical protein